MLRDLNINWSLFLFLLSFSSSLSPTTCHAARSRVCRAHAPGARAVQGADGQGHGVPRGGGAARVRQRGRVQEDHRRWDDGPC